MNSIPGENRELDALVNQPKETHKGVTCLALTFGTLLSSQGADALVLQPFEPSFEAICPLYTELRNGRTSGVRPAVSQALRPGPFSLGAGRTVHHLWGPLQGGPRRRLPLGRCPLRRASVSVEPAVEPDSRTSKSSPSAAPRFPPHPRCSSWSRGRWPAAGRRCPDVWGNRVATERLPHTGGSWVTAFNHQPDSWTSLVPDGVRPRHGVGTGR
jgi:hypothetical protein